MNRVLYFQIMDPENLVKIFGDNGYECKSYNTGGLKVFVTADGFQEFKLLLSEAVTIAVRLGARFLGFE